ncbi:MAG: hypothetical protein V5A77_07185 [Candidatus Bipolaricaulota bacterium]|nr:hypothetical protein [Candidatus Bipolaricaulota bacterium]
MNKINWRILGLIGAVLFVSLVVVFMATQNQDTGENQKIPEGERSLAHRMAISDAGSYVDEDHPTVQEFEELLSNLEEATSDSKEKIRELTIESVTELDENYDVNVKLLDFLKEANEMAEEIDWKISYTEIVAKVKVALSQEETEA